MNAPVFNSVYYEASDLPPFLYKLSTGNDMTKWDRITVDPKMMNGQPCIRGMRLTVRRVLEALTVYPKWDDLIAEYPELESGDIKQALDFAACNLDDEIISIDVA